MNDWLPIAIAIVAFSVISGGLRRRFAPMKHEKRLSNKGAFIYSMGGIVLFVIFLMFGLAVIRSMTNQ